VELEAPRQPLFPLFESSLSMTAYHIWGEGDKQEGGRQAAREDGKGGGARITMHGCSYCNNSGGNAKALLQYRASLGTLLLCYMFV
jgi:hypothetical protein